MVSFSTINTNCLILLERFVESTIDDLIKIFQPIYIWTYVLMNEGKIVEVERLLYDSM